jgi:sugar phosphate permease
MRSAAVTEKSVRWARLVPIVFITYSLAYLDRVNYGFGAAGGLAKTLGITAGVSSLLGATFFLGYFLFQVPGARYAETKSAKRLLFWSLILWGIFASCTGLLTNVPLLFADRFLLGIVESVVLPGLLIFLSHWFTRSERSRTNTYLILGNPVTVLWASILSGYLIAAVGWRWMFIVEGIPALVWAFVWNALVEDNPDDARWLPAAEREAVDAALAHEQTQLTPVRNFAAAVRSPNVIKLAAQYFFWSVGIYGFILWLPSIIKGASNLGIVATGWLSAVPYALAIAAMVLISQYSDRTLNRRGVVWPSLLVGALAFYGSYAAGPSNFWLAYALLVIAGAAMYAPYGPFFAIIPEMLPRNVAGSSMALINSMGALGSFVGTYVVGLLNGLTGGPGVSYIFMAGCLVIATVLTLAVRLTPARAEPVAAVPTA